MVTTGACAAWRGFGQAKGPTRLMCGNTLRICDTQRFRVPCWFTCSPSACRPGVRICAASAVITAGLSSISTPFWRIAGFSRCI